MNFIKLTAILLLSTSTIASAQQRARDLGIQFEGKPGSYNAITDVKGVLVGYKTLIKGDDAERQVN